MALSAWLTRPRGDRLTRATILAVVACGVSVSCSVGGSTVKPSLYETSLAGVKADHQAWQERFSAFRTQANAAISEANLLRNHPGWPELERIVRARPSLKRFEGEAVAREKTAAALVEWGRRWDSSGENLMRIYESLVEEGRHLERQRIQLLRERHDVFTRGSSEIMRQVNASYRVAEIQLLSAVHDTWDKVRQLEFDAVNLYGIDALGLYQRRSRGGLQQ